MFAKSNFGLLTPSFQLFNLSLIQEMTTIAMKKPDISHYVLMAILLVLAIIVGSHFPQKALSWDIFGYYLYLPFTFIYQDLGLRNFAIVQDIIDQYQNTSSFYQALPQAGGYYVMKYPMGMALMYLPWFAIGHVWAMFSDYAADGFSYPYQAALYYGSFVYTALGLVYLRKSLRSFFKPITVAIVLISIVFGTNYMVHTVWHGQGLMSHNYLFFTFSLILWLTIRWHRKPAFLTALGLGASIGISALSRPTEILVLMVPVFWQVTDKETLLQKIRLFWERRHDLIGAALTVALFGAMQLLYYKVFTGKFLYNSYGGNAGEGLDLDNPYLWQVLFSFRKGWLLYTPLMGLALLGFVSLYRKMKPVFYALFLFFLVSFYVIASWSCWWYADCFSQRAVIPMYVMLSVPLAALIETVLRQKTWKKLLFFLLLVVLIAFNLFQSWQFLSGIIHTSRMTKAAYEAVFLKTKPVQNMQDLLTFDYNQSPERVYQQYTFETLNTYQLSFNDGIDPALDSVPVFAGKAAKLKNTQPYSGYIDIPFDQLGLDDFGLIRITAHAFSHFTPNKNPFFITATFMHNGYAYGYRSFVFDGETFDTTEWNTLSFLYLTPVIRKKKDVLRVQAFLKGTEPVYIDEIEVEVLKPKR